MDTGCPLDRAKSGVKNFRPGPSNVRVGDKINLKSIFPQNICRWNIVLPLYKIIRSAGEGVSMLVRVCIWIYFILVRNGWMVSRFDIYCVSEGGKGEIILFGI